MTPSAPTLFLTVGLPGAGKTTRARELAREHGILRLTPDEWMAPLFGHNDAAGRRDILEGRMVWAAHQVLVSGASVVLDFGCWSAEERYAIRVLAESAGARFAMEYLHVPEAERRARCERRWAQAPGTTFEMTDGGPGPLRRALPPAVGRRAGQRSGARSAVRVRDLAAVGEPPVAVAARAGRSRRLSGRTG